jgi:hypothetical protein
MPLTQKEKDKRDKLLIEAAGNLDPAEPIDSSDPRYVDCAEVRGEEGILVTKINDTGYY